MMDIDELFSVFDEAKGSEELHNLNKEEKNESDHSNEKDCAEDFIRSVPKRKRSVDLTDTDAAKKSRISSVLDFNPDDYVSGAQVKDVDCEGACIHEVVVPPDAEYKPLKPRAGPLAKEYQFTLDPFQNEAIRCLENNQSVLVSAHTSAGKTVVAEYAIALSLREKRRVIYTTPIKALSNQKYREFLKEFEDVGLMTGDVTINPTASCLIMTTEILRNMLYRGSEVMREIGWVIFDEVHYMRDKSRGVVWEETIILLPDFVHYVFLSATIPNARQFAEWICCLHKQSCHVVYTEYRPVPLQQYIFPVGAENLYLVVDVNGNFFEEQFNAAMHQLQVKPYSFGDKKGKKDILRGHADCCKIIRLIMQNGSAPVIVFSFSKKECEAYAAKMTEVDFNSDEEKKLVEEVFTNAMNVLADEDKKLPHVVNALPMLKRGIGIHHGGLLPVLKETIEILFSEGLVKVLFATETFAMGLNMPARTVLFTNPRKFDGHDHRWITSGEYIQMSGRAGRRGLDDRGIVILMVDKKMTPSVGKEMIRGLPDPLNSSFHLTYNMILNLLRVEGLDPKHMLSRSFFQFQKCSDMPKLYEKLKQLCEELNAFEIPNEEDLAVYFRTVEQLESLETEARSYVARSERCAKFLQRGRLVRVKNGEDDFGWGAVVSRQKKSVTVENESEDAVVDYVIEVLLHVSTESAGNKSTAHLKPPPDGDKGEVQVVPIKMDLIHQFSIIRVVLKENLRLRANRMDFLKTREGVQAAYAGGVPLLDPVKDMKIKDKIFLNVMKKIEKFKSRLANCEDLENDPNFDVYCKKRNTQQEIRNVEIELKKAKALLQMEELKCCKRVLRKMGFCSPSGVIELKGQVACEISSANELLLTEMIFNGVFNNLNVHQTVALLSCFVCEEKSSEVPELTEELSAPLSSMQEIALRIAKVSKEAMLDIDSEQYVNSFKPHLMLVVHSWSKGVSFDLICKMTDIFEGNIIRSMRRLEELLRQMCHAAKVIGNSEVENKFAEGIKLIKRDIVFAASLYL